ncbi:hypothetical protein ABBQ32_014026 [Trebouxia sp. C0010 RCD-2024]
MIDNRYAWTSMIRVVTSTHHVKRCNIKPQDTSLPSGQVPFDTSDMTYKGQTEQVLTLLDDILKEAGSCKQNILKVCSYLRSIDEGADGYNKAWDAWVDQQNLPVRTTIEAKLMRPDFLVEIDLIAAVL